MRYLLGFILICFLLVLIGQRACTPQKLTNSRGIAEEAERRTVKRFTEKQIKAEAARLGDSITTLADSLLAQRLTTALQQGGVAAALNQYPPEAYPEVKSLAGKYGATPQRRPAGKLTPPIQMLNATEFLFTKPITFQEGHCGPCHGLVRKQDLALLRQHYPKFNYSRRQADQAIGYWYVPIARKAVLERLTLKGMKKPRTR